MMIHKLSSPISEETIRKLKVGNQVLISGVVFTGRDAVHKYLHEGGTLPDEVNLEGGILYHCGPVVLQDEHSQWQVTAAGPTTSIREEPYQGDIMKRFGIRGVIGKGGMADKTLAACQEHGAVYLHAIGGAAQRFWSLTCKVIDREDLVDDPRFVQKADRVKNNKVLVEIMEQELLKKTTQEWFELLDAEGIPAGPVMNHEQMFSDPQTLARDMIAEVDHPTAGNTRLVGVPIKLSDTPGSIRRPAPRHGEHTEEVLNESINGVAAE